MSTDTPIKRQRHNKKRVLVSSSLSTSSSECISVTTDTISDVTTTSTVKRAAKKKFPIVAVITPDGIEGTLHIPSEARKPLIVHLPIQSNNVIFNDNILCYDPAPPPCIIEPYDGQSDIFSSSSENVISKVDILQLQKEEYLNIAKPAQSLTPVHHLPVKIYKDVTMLVQYKDSTECKKIPEKSDSACFWCCYTFECQPVVLPIKDEGEYLQVYGNFCSPECAMSYLFDIRQDFHSRWEQFSLLNRIYSSGTAVIRPAPSKFVLKLFGGPMDIAEFRGDNYQAKMRVDIHIPPMVSLLSTMDTKPIDFYDINLTKDAMETAKERLQRAEITLKLQRTKPLKAWESTLDACMNLRIKSTSRKNE